MTNKRKANETFDSEEQYLALKKEYDEKAEIFWAVEHELKECIKRAANYYYNERERLLNPHHRYYDMDVEYWGDHKEDKFYVCLSSYRWGDREEFDFYFPRKLLWSKNVQQDAIEYAKIELAETLKKREEEDKKKLDATRENAYKEFLALKEKYGFDK